MVSKLEVCGSILGGGGGSEVFTITADVEYKLLHIVGAVTET